MDIAIETKEHIIETAEQAREKWISQVALYSALLAATAAVAALLAGVHSDSAMSTQLMSSDRWGYYQAKGIKAQIVASKIEMLQAFGKPTSSFDKDNVKRYSDEQQSIASEAKFMQDKSRRHLMLHTMLSRAVTFLQVAIAVAAISVLTRRRMYWGLSMVFSATGFAFFCIAIFNGAIQ